MTANGHVYTPPKTKAYEKHVRVCAFQALQVYKVEHGKWDTSQRYALSAVLFMGDRRKRDLDNCIKSISDALNGLGYDDDSQIDEVYVARDYDKERPRAVVSLRVLG
jgi:Holliday junction resolvase RusA-like endonuclease